MGERLLRHEEVIERTGLSAVTIWRMERKGDFPRRRQVSPNRVGWIASEVDEWIRSRPLAEGRDA